MAPLFWWVAVAGVARGLALITGKSPYRDKFPSGADPSLSAVGVMVADHVRRVPPVAGSAMSRRPAWACRARLDRASRVTASTSPASGSLTTRSIGPANRMCGG